MWKMLQYKNPDDYVIATGKTYTIKDFIIETCKKLNFNPVWQGKGLNEKCFDAQTNKLLVKINKRYFRPAEVNFLRGDSRKAKKFLNGSQKQI